MNREFDIACMHAAKRRYSTKIKSAKIYTLEIYPLYLLDFRYFSRMLSAVSTRSTKFDSNALAISSHVSFFLCKTLVTTCLRAFDLSVVSGSASISFCVRPSCSPICDHEGTTSFSSDNIVGRSLIVSDIPVYTSIACNHNYNYDMH